jgi:Putative zinc-finger
VPACRVIRSLSLPAIKPAIKIIPCLVPWVFRPRFQGEISMNCNDFQQRIAERMAGELPAEQKKEMEAHEQTCLACQRAVQEWRQMESLLRASWPPEDPRVPFFVPSPQRQGGWLTTARTWFGLASMAAVTACLLLLVMLRPSLRYERSQLSINFGRGEKAAVMPAEVVTQAQVQTWVQQALAQAPVEGTLTAQPTSSNEEAARRIAQIAVQVEMLRRNQLSLWQQVEQHGLYLQSAWRDPLELKQRQNTSRP